VIDKHKVANAADSADQSVTTVESDQSVDQDQQALKISKALENAAANTKPSQPLFGDALGDKVAPAPANSETLSGRQSSGASTMPKRTKRRRSTALLFVKIGLPLVALLTVSYLGYWWYVHNRESVINVQSPDTPSGNAPVVTVNNFKYSAADSKNRPYTITADSATQPQDKAIDTITLVRPQANFTLNNNHWMTITAQNGLYHRNADTVDLNGDVTLFHDSGMSYHTNSAQIDMKAKVAAGSDPVQGKNANTEISSEGFRVLDDGNVIIFTGKTKLKLYGKGKDGNG
jgi:lipopolysaccharide export system protein LptC